MGLFLGMGTAVAIDATLLAEEEVPIEAPATKSSIAPWLSVSRTNAIGGVGGAF